MAKINNGLVSLFTLMSSGAFVGKLVNVFGCLCSEAEMLKAINNNVATFFAWYANNGGVPIDNTINSWADLAAIPTTGLTVPVVKVWVNDADLSFKIVQLRAGTDATDTAGGVQRPDDYNAATNAKVWYQC